MNCSQFHSSDRLPEIFQQLNVIFSFLSDLNIGDKLTTKIKTSFTTALVSVNDSHIMRGRAANHVKIKLKGSGS